MRMLGTTALLASVLTLAGCGAEPKGAPPSAPVEQPAAEKAAAAKPAAASTDTGGELRVLTSEDMEKLRAERKDQIERSTPLGEENDPVQAVQKSNSDRK